MTEGRLTRWHIQIVNTHLWNLSTRAFNFDVAFPSCRCRKLGDILATARADGGSAGLTAYGATTFPCLNEKCPI